MKVKDRYLVDRLNRLVIKRNRKKIFANGRFSIDKKNQLIYRLNEPSGWRHQYNLPDKIKFKGKWRLNSNYDLEFELDETKQQGRGDRLILKGNIVSVDKDSLVFKIKSYSKEGQASIALLKLVGFWQSDRFNRLSFVIEKKPSADILIFKGLWQLNSNQKILYLYEKRDLLRKKKSLVTLTFEGFWQIEQSNRLTYVLRGSEKSQFEFHARIETPNLWPKEGVIKYRLGIGLGRYREVKIISLYGTWRFSRKSGLSFLMNYGKGKLRRINFACFIYLSKKDKVIFSLLNKDGKPLGINITFNRRFLEKCDAEVFLHLEKLSRAEKAIKVGVRIPF